MPNQGPLSREDLMALWKSVTDPAYHRPLLENEDSGVEFVEQAAEQFARVSKSIDTNTQAMFILPWSGQTAPPAGGAQHASVNLSVRRNNRFDDALVFREGVAVFEQRLNDWGPEGPVDVS